MNCQAKKTIGKKWNMRHSFTSNVLACCTYPAKFKVTYKKRMWAHGNPKYPYGANVEITKYLCGIHANLYKKAKDVKIEKLF